MVPWIAIAFGAKKIVSLGFTMIQRHSFITVVDHLKTLGLLFLSLVVVIVAEFSTWKQRQYNHDDSKAHSTFVYQLLMVAFNDENRYTSYFLLTSLMLCTMGLLQPPLYGGLVFLSSVKCCINLFSPLIDLANLQFVYQQIMNSQYDAYARVISNGTLSVREYTFVGPPFGLFISIFVCLLRILLSLHVWKRQYHSYNKMIGPTPFGPDFVLEVVLVILPYTSKNFLSLTRRLILRVLFIKISQTARDKNVQIWLGSQLFGYLKSKITKENVLDKLSQWLSRGARTAQNIPGFNVVCNILFCRYLLAVTILFLTFYYAEEPSSAVNQFQLKTTRTRLVFFCTTPNTLRLLLVVVLPFIYFLDAIAYATEAHKHEKAAFIWFFTGKNPLPSFMKKQNLHNNETPSPNESNK